MALSILTNTASLNAQKNLSSTQEALSSSISKLSSGMRINKAGDDAAGLGISESLKAQVRSFGQAQRNANDAISMSQVAEGAMNEMQGIVSRMRELSVQAANDTLGADERGYIHTEFQQLSKEVDRISKVTNFNGKNMLDGSNSQLTFQVGIFNSTDDRITMSISKLSTSTLGGTGTNGKITHASLSTAAKAQTAIATFDAAIKNLSAARAKVGASQNRLAVTVSNLATSHENLSAANSRIRDVDVASESAQLTKAQILSQAGLAVLAQANQLPQSALSLLR
jgi:flagellin